MKMSGHVVLSTLCGIGLYPFLGKEIIVPWAISIFLDIDHYLWYFMRFRKLNIQQAIKFFENRLERSTLCIFHLIEVWLLFGILSFFSRVLLLIFIGMTFHLVLDIYSDMRDIRYRIRIEKEPVGEKNLRLVEFFKRQEEGGRKLSLIRYLLLRKRRQLGITTQSSGDNSFL